MATRVGNYTVHREVSRTPRILEATHDVRGQAFAIEVIRGAHPASRAEDAASTLATLNDLKKASVPGLFPISDVWNDAGTIYIACAPISAISLGTLLRSVALDASALASIGLELVETLTHLNALALHVQHLDIATTFIGEDGHVFTASVLADLATPFDADRAQPRGALGRHAPANSQSDQYILGRLLASAALRRDVGSSSDPIDWSRYPTRPDFQALLPVLQRMVANAPNDRFSSLATCANALAEVAHLAHRAWPMSADGAPNRAQEGTPDRASLQGSPFEVLVKMSPDFASSLPNSVLRRLRERTTWHNSADDTHDTGDTDTANHASDQRDDSGIEDTLRGLRYPTESGNFGALREPPAWGHRLHDRLFAPLPEDSFSTADEFAVETGSRPLHVWDGLTSASNENTAHFVVANFSDDATTRATMPAPTDTPTDDTRSRTRQARTANRSGPRSSSANADADANANVNARGAQTERPVTFDAAGHVRQPQKPRGRRSLFGLFAVALVVGTGLLPLTAKLMPATERRTSDASPATNAALQPIVWDLKPEPLDALSPPASFPSPAPHDASASRPVLSPLAQARGAEALYARAVAHLRAHEAQDAEALLQACIYVSDDANCHDALAAILALEERGGVEYHLTKGRQRNQKRQRTESAR
ncbi:MAG: hypothetical protein H6729_13420 [Deltaproteobacteria bacterium]|nr:hypothetical protein [Deltaproteobacteria bacterium]